MSFVVISPLSHAGSHAVQYHLGRQLRVAYAGLPVTPAPDQLSELLRQLDRAARNRRPV